MISWYCASTIPPNHGDEHSSLFLTHSSLLLLLLLLLLLYQLAVGCSRCLRFVARRENSRERAAKTAESRTSTKTNIQQQQQQQLKKPN